MRCFATVGTTSFDAMIDQLNRIEVRELLSRNYGVHELLVQFGRGTAKPNSQEAELLHVVVSSYDFKPTLAEDMAGADLVISHAGAGSIMEALRLGKPLIVVVNDKLMGNHQLELAGALAEAGYLICAPSPESLLDVLQANTAHTLAARLKPYPSADTGAFGRLVDEEVFGSEKV